VTTSEERIAKNEAIFRAANDGIGRSAQRLGFSDLVPFICECDDPGCREFVRLSLDEYNDVRGNPRRFFKTFGHEQTLGAAGHVVARNERYVVVEKTGRAGEVAEEEYDRPETAE
jgi:hypothetical protein